MKNKNIIYISAIVIAATLSIAIFYNATRLKIDDISLNKIYAVASKNDYTVLHLGKVSKKDETILKKLKNNYNVSLVNSRASEEDMSLYLEGYYNKDVEYIVFVNASIVGVMNKNQDYEYYQELMDKYIFHVIPDDEVKYKIPQNDTEFIEAAARKKEYTIAVFGYADCSYCTLFKPVINEIANDYNLDIYYIDGSSFSYYEEVIAMDYLIPGKCTKDGKDTKTSGSFATPMTLILKNNETIDCIRGYVPKTEFISVLKNNKIIK